MERFYTVTLELNSHIPPGIFEEKFKGYILSSGLFVTENLYAKGPNIFAETKEGSGVGFTPYNCSCILKRVLEESEAVRYALTIAKQLESATPPFDPKLTFNPNFIKLYVGTDSKGESIKSTDFKKNAIELQKRLYGGGDIAYLKSSGDFSFLLGREHMIVNYNPRRIVNVEGTAKPANSLDDLLARI